MRIFKKAGYNVFATKEYMSRVRGGMNSTQIRVSSEAVRAFAARTDILVALDKGALGHVGKRVSPETIVLGEKEILGDEVSGNRHRFFDVPFTKAAAAIGNKVYSNVVAVGALAYLFGIERRLVCDCVGRFFSGKSAEVVENNNKAAGAGFDIVGNLSQAGAPKFDISSDVTITEDMLVNGAEAVGLGAIAGGCNFVSSYPMSPSTAVLAFLAQHGEEFGVIAEQAEDEIAAMNMAIGAWYAGGRAMVTTSGGGFALMTEGLSLAGMLESPMVIHLAQRPGPATGLPTRTEQGDLELVLYAGHGEFPRIILAPGTLEDGFYLTQKAFNLADRFQVPVFLLTDQYFVDSYYNTPVFDLSGVKVDKHIVETQENYRRYELAADGISPRGIPGCGRGLVAVDSDEHDLEGHITEDLELRTRMVDKRLKKGNALGEKSVAPEFTGPQDARTLLVCWGSTRNIVAEAIGRLDTKDVAMLHFKQVYPLPKETAELLGRAQKTIIIENNATCQFGRLIKTHTGIDIDERILKYNGLAFSMEEIAAKVESVL
jgi:2-oxoglutarate ferredoxin oxidoreductase subunit alpha